jgi:hypothetical protein
VSDNKKWGLSLYADCYMTLCVHSISDPNVNFPSASCVPYATYLRDKHWPTDSTGLCTENKIILLNHNHFLLYILFPFPRLKVSIYSYCR